MALAIAACSSQKTAPDPALLEQEIADTRAEELELVRATIRDPGRAERFIGLLADRDRLIDGFVVDVGRHRQAVARLNADYGASRADFEELFADYNRQRTAAQAALIELVAGMKQATTAEEWDVISTFQIDRLDIRRLVYRESSGVTQ